ncbi:MAG: bifunctional adenosylcobinamide kinase/adenosylcobinamide-phosphate guanylyltransferase [Candidatus Symbiobacter sp.]|nr:bifunctional adenosylcobinamide kinase/adenosylcobinamide-phosphate guanylyltransferase [Candidatus Symbiobacter sp.]
MNDVKITLILGGAASGKSEFAERMLSPHPNRHYIATTITMENDPEMAAKIARHRQRRSEHWQTHEIPVNLTQELPQIMATKEPILVECLSMWVSNLMMAEKNIHTETENLIKTIENPTAPIIFVSLEVGLGIVPDNALARQYRDALGQLNQKIAAVAENVILVVAGQPLYLKGQNQNGI